MANEPKASLTNPAKNAAPRNRWQGVVIPLFIAAFLLSACGGSSYGYGYPGYSYDDPLSAMLGELDAFLLPIQFILAGAGLAMLLAGYKIFRTIIMIPGVILGGAVGMAIGADESSLWAIIGLILGALLGAGLALLIHDLMVFLIGAGIGAVLVSGIILAGNEIPDALPLLLAAVVGGFGLLALSKAAIVFYTSAVGAMLFGLGIGATGWWLLLFFAVGVGVQYGLAHALGDTIGSEAGAAALGAAGTTSLLSQKHRNESRAGGAHAPDRLAQPPAPMHAALFVDTQGQSYSLHDQMLVGRSSDCSLRIQERNVSRRHALLRLSGEDWYIQDQGSAGGTFVNGERVQARRLFPGDQVAIGYHSFRFEMR